MKPFIKKHYHHLALAALVIIHTLTTFFTTIFGDDYYYANFVQKGYDYFVSENIFHYLHTNGRALVHILDELLIGWNFDLWRVFNIVNIASLAVVIAKIAAKSCKPDSSREKYQSALTFTCVILALTDTAVLRQSFYWATGMMNYLFPAVLSLWFYYFFARDFEENRGSWLLVPLALVSSITTEQASAAAFLTALCFVVSAFVVKKRIPRPAYFASLIVSAAGLATILFAPGTSERKTYYPDFYAKPLLERIKSNFPTLSNVIYGRGGLCAAILVGLIIIAVVSYRYYNEGKLPLLSLLVGSEAAAAAGIYLWSLTVNSSIHDEWWMKTLLLIPVGAAMIYTAFRYFTRGEIDELFFVWCAAGMQIIMLISPEYGPRTLTISLVSLAVALVKRLADDNSPEIKFFIGFLAFALTPYYVKETGSVMLIFAGILILSLIILRAGCEKRPELTKIAGAFALAASLSQFSAVAIGYAGNLPVIGLNKQSVENYLAEETPPSSIIFYYLPNDNYRYTMPYDNPYHAAKLLELSGIDPKIQVWYEFLPDYDY